MPRCLILISWGAHLRHLLFAEGRYGSAMRLTKCLKNINRMLEHYSGFNPSPLSIKQFIDFGKYFFTVGACFSLIFHWAMNVECWWVFTFSLKPIFLSSCINFVSSNIIQLGKLWGAESGFTTFRFQDMMQYPEKCDQWHAR